MKSSTFSDLTTAASSLSVALFMSFSLHSLLLTTKFDFKPSYQTDTKLDIVLVQTKTDKVPKDAKFIGQANQDGGGIDNEEERAKTPVKAPFHAFETNVVTTPFPFQQMAQSQFEQLQIITVRESTFKIQNKQFQDDVKTKVQTTGEDLQNTPDVPMNESDFFKNQRSMIASIQSDSDEKYQEFKNRPPHKIIGAKTKEVHHAKYMNDWTKKVEQIALTQKPPKELKKKLKGSLIVKVSFRSDGTLYGIEILQSSKNPILDDYTLQIARLATPFRPFEKDKKILEELGANGILEIVRTWKWNLNPQSSENPSLKLDSND
jgi:periplasmic protein TonB